MSRWLQTRRGPSHVNPWQSSRCAPAKRCPGPHAAGGCTPQGTPPSVTRSPRRPPRHLPHRRCHRGHHHPGTPGHLRSLRVNVPRPFAIVDGEIGPDNVFAVDPESSFDNHVVWRTKPKNIGLQEPLARTHAQKTRQTLGKTRAKSDLFAQGFPPSCIAELEPFVFCPLTSSSSLLNQRFTSPSPERNIATFSTKFQRVVQVLISRVNYCLCLQLVLNDILKKCGN